MTGRAYVISTHDEERAAIVYAESSAKARAQGPGVLDEEYIRTRTRRAPEFDDQHPSNETLCRDHGWRFECYGCGRLVYSDDLDEGGRFDYDDAICPRCAGPGLSIASGKEAPSSAS